MAGSSRPAKRLLGCLVVLVNVLRAGCGVFPPETPSRRRVTNGVLGEPVTGLFAGWRQRRTPPLGGLRGEFGMASAQRASTYPILLKSWGRCASQVVLAPGAAR